MNHLAAIERLSNRYFVLRHGHSLANQQGLIVSHPKHGLTGFGLSSRGTGQLQQCLLSEMPLDRQTRIVSSDFRRARESAEILHRLLDCIAPIRYEEALRERFFGDYELTADSGYTQVWAADAEDADSRRCNVESANQVMARVSRLIAECEGKYSAATFVLVSHGDALQILQAAFAGLDASQHRRLDHLETAEIRELTRGAQD